MRVLKKGGTLELRTDSQNYFEYSFVTLQGLNQYDIKIRKNHNLEISSKYEDRWKKQEKNIYDITITNHKHSQTKEKLQELKFDFYPDFTKVKNKFTNHTIKGKDFFVHFEEIYDIDATKGVIKLSLGSFEKCEHKYLLFNNKMIQYFPNRSLPIEQNLKSHKKIREYLNV
jgi:tRNA (guanine-N7-)-methyltransferase